MGLKIWIFAAIIILVLYQFVITPQQKDTVKDAKITAEGWLDEAKQVFDEKDLGKPNCQTTADCEQFGNNTVCNSETGHCIAEGTTNE